VSGAEEGVTEELTLDATSPFCVPSFAVLASDGGRRHRHARVPSSMVMKQ
jgi:hypothetical protein